MKNKQLLNEVSRFQQIAGLQAINSLNEDMEQEGGMQAPVNETDWSEIAKMVGPAVAIAGPAMLAFKGLMKSAKDNIIKALQAKGQPIPDSKTLDQLAVKAITGEMDRVTGAGMAEGDMEEGI